MNVRPSSSFLESSAPRGRKLENMAGAGRCVGICLEGSGIIPFWNAMSAVTKPVSNR